MPPPRRTEPLAELDPVAQVLVDLPLPHLDHCFDYAVPMSMAAVAQPGSRVRIRFAGRLVDGFVVARVAASDHPGTLARLQRVASAEPVLTAALLAAAQAVATEYAGTVADVLRTAIPPRQARAEAAVPPPRDEVSHVGVPVPGLRFWADPPAAWGDYLHAASFLRATRQGGAPAAVWTALPGELNSSRDWPAVLAATALHQASVGLGTLIVVPDYRDLARVSGQLRELLAAYAEPGFDPAGLVVELTASASPALRWQTYLRIRRGLARIVVGTRAGVWAPLPRLGLIAVWDDGDDNHIEPHSPGWHVREVARIRATQERAGLLLGGYTRTAAAQQLLAQGSAHPLEPTRARVRALSPRVRTGDDTGGRTPEPGAARARVPLLVLSTLREQLAHGPVLVQVPRRGWSPRLVCTRCGERARCALCQGDLAVGNAGGQLTCSRCGVIAVQHSCGVCGGAGVRAVQVGGRRTADELGRAFPGVVVRSSDAESGVLAAVPGSPALVVATVGAEPLAEGGYAAGVLLDADLTAVSSGVNAEQEALRRWAAAGALLRPGAPLVLVGLPTGDPLVQEFLRWDPAAAAARDLAGRHSARLPPAVRVVRLRGSAAAVADMTQAVLAEVARLAGEHTAGSDLATGSESATGWESATGSAPMGSAPMGSAPMGSKSMGWESSSAVVEAVGPVPWKPAPSPVSNAGSSSSASSGGGGVQLAAGELALEGVDELDVQLLLRPRGRAGPGGDYAARWLVQGTRLVNARRSLAGRPVVHIRVDPQDLA